MRFWSWVWKYTSFLILYLIVCVLYHGLLLWLLLGSLTFHPCCFKMSVRGLYSLLGSMVVSRNRSWQYLDSKNHIVYVGVGSKGVWLFRRGAIMHKIFGSSFAMHWDVWTGHVHVNNHSCLVESGGWLSIVLELVRVKYRMNIFSCSVCTLK